MGIVGHICSSRLRKHSKTRYKKRKTEKKKEEKKVL